MYTASKANGFGIITSEDEKYYTVEFENGKVRNIIKTYVTIYATEEEASEILEQIENEAEEAREAREERLAGCASRTSERAELNLMNAMNNLPSSMR